jgi:hypothetical protein
MASWVCNKVLLIHMQVTDDDMCNFGGKKHWSSKTIQVMFSNSNDTDEFVNVNYIKYFLSLNN